MAEIREQEFDLFIRGFKNQVAFRRKLVAELRAGRRLAEEVEQGTHHYCRGVDCMGTCCAALRRYKESTNV